MGVEPTRQNFSIRLIGFEDRGRHPPDNAYHKHGNSFWDIDTKQILDSHEGRRPTPKDMTKTSNHTNPSSKHHRSNEAEYTQRAPPCFHDLHVREEESRDRDFDDVRA